MRRIDSLISEFSSRMELGKGQKRQKALDLWESAAGEEIARYAKPAGFDRGVLIIRVLHPAATMELGLRKKEILRRLNGQAGEVLFTEIRTITPGKRKGVYFDR